MKEPIFAEHEQIILATQRWVNSLVVDLNLCPFAKRELVKQRVRFAVCDATTEQGLGDALQTEIEWLTANPTIETTLLIHPKVLQNFYDYNDFLVDVDNLLFELNLEGVYQVASFHPDYQFAGIGVDAVENYTNRSPYPLLHILREASLTQAIDNYPDVHLIPDRNMALMKKMGKAKLKDILRQCMS